MAGEVAPMDVRLLAALTADSLDGINVRQLCRQRAVSPKTFYKWRARYRAEGLAGLEPQSRRPVRSPNRLSPVTEDVIVELRKRLADEGLDAGPGTIHWHLVNRSRIRPVPSEATIWRALVRRGMVTPQPAKRPRSSWRRFEADHPNECWQIDATDWALADGTGVEIINLLDDHSRVAVGSVAVASTTTEAAWAAFSAAAETWGLPTRCLSDNGLAFSGRLRGFEVAFEIRLRAAGIHPVTSRPYHPQTCGKVERFQQTLKKWLRARPPADTGAALQAQLGQFLAYYNHQRPHRGIGRVVPYQRWAATPRVAPDGQPLPAPQRRVSLRVSANGTIEARPYEIGLGIEHAGRPGEVVLDGTHATVFVDGKLVRHLTLDPGRRYQPTGRPGGWPRRRPDTT
jgi:transposase InsO family protein